MPTKLGEPVSPLWRGRYPAMLEEDVPVWDSFLVRNMHLFQRVYYNVRVGGIVSTEPGLDEKMREMFYSVSAKRIDAVAELKDEVWIIEVGFKPGLRAVGQLQVYFALWHDDPKINKPAKAVLVAMGIDSDLQRSLEIYGIKFIAV